MAAAGDALCPCCGVIDLRGMTEREMDDHVNECLTMSMLRAEGEGAEEATKSVKGEVKPEERTGKRRASIEPAPPRPPSPPRASSRPASSSAVEAPPSSKKPKAGGGSYIDSYFQRSGGPSRASVNDTVRVDYTCNGRTTRKTHRDLVELGLPVSVHPCFLSPEAADEILTTMIRDPTFEQPVRVVAGRETRPNRLQKWIKDAEGEVDDSPTNLLPAFQDALLRVEAFVNEEGGKRGILTACTKWRPTFWIANCYRDGTESLAAHSDDLAQLGPRPIIAGLTFGATRIFRLQPYNAQGKIDSTVKIDLHLPHASLVMMWPPCQEDYKHSVPEQPKGLFPHHPIGGSTRISVTMRWNRDHVIPLCHCGTRCMLHMVRSGPNINKYFWQCNRAEHINTCSFRQQWNGEVA